MSFRRRELHPRGSSSCCCRGRVLHSCSPNKP
ncbi:unnamed protein product, partial [Allacma fusca]